MWQLDLGLAAVAVAFLVALRLVDELPPHVFTEDGILREALLKNDQIFYLQMLTTFSNYAGCLGTHPCTYVRLSYKTASSQQLADTAASSE